MRQIKHINQDWTIVCSKKETQKSQKSRTRIIETIEQKNNFIKKVYICNTISTIMVLLILYEKYVTCVYSAKE